MDLTHLQDKVVAILTPAADLPEGGAGVVITAGRAEWDCGHWTVADGRRRFRLPQEALPQLRPGPHPLLQDLGIAVDYFVHLDHLPVPDLEPGGDADAGESPRFPPEWLNAAVRVTNDWGASVPRPDRLRQAVPGIPEGTLPELLTYCDAISAAACELAEEVRAGRLKLQAATLELSRRFPGLDGLTAMQTMGLGMAATR